MIKILKHIIPWLVFSFLIIYFERKVHPGLPFSRYLITQSLLILITLVLFYLNYLVFVPKFLVKRKLFQYTLSALFIMLIGNILSISVSMVHDMLMSDSDGLTKRHLGSQIVTSSITSLTIVLVSAGIRLISQYNKDTLKRAELKEAAKIAELEALKAKINPHFLYNSFNSLYALAKIKSDKTASAILQLSDIMRYVTYKSSKKKVPIFEELDFIKNYIDFQKLRVNHPEQKIVTNIQTPSIDFMISPLLLIPFAENAFKHSNLLRASARIEINFQPLDYGFKYVVSNMIETNKNTNSGIGLNTLKKILDYAYPDSHSIQLYTKGNMHYAELILNLKK